MHGESAQIREPSRRLLSRLRDAADKEDLLRVQAHNIRNVLGAIQGLCRRLAKHSNRMDQFVARFDRRVRALGDSHSLFVQHDWRGATLDELLQVQLAEFGGMDGKRIAASGPGVYLRVQATQSLGLVIHELAANAAKHGALSSQGGSIAITWTQNPHSQEVHLTWEESGGPEVQPPTHLGFGDVVFDLWERQLDCKISVDYRREGILCSLTIGASSLYRSEQLIWLTRQRARGH